MLLCALLFMPLAGSALAAPGDPAAVPVQNLTAALLKSWRAGGATSTTQRYRDLEPVVDQVFDIPFMTRVAVGRDWANIPAEQQTALIAAFKRFTLANYVHNFRDYDGQKFEIDDNVLSRGEYKIVQTRLLTPHDTASQLYYRMHSVDGTWRIVDVYYNGVSELSLRRSEFTVAIASGGAPELIAHLNKLSDGLLK
jgi:phospholipid transport system substrate-binding protein